MTTTTEEAKQRVADPSPELVERMVELIRDLRADHLQYNLHDREQAFVRRTAAILAELEPVDPDWEAAVRIGNEFSLYPDEQINEAMVAAIKYGRENPK